MKLVKVGRVGKKVLQVAINDNSNVNAALIAAGVLPFANEDIWLNHQIVGESAGVKNGDTVILEPRKATPISNGMQRLIDFLIEEDVFCEYDYEDDDGNTNYCEAVEDNKLFIDRLINRIKGL